LVSTVTTAGIIINTISTSALTGLLASTSIAAVVSLIFFLITRQLANANGSGTSLRIARFFNVGIVPLVTAFAIIVALKIAELIA